jgi:ABC-type Fe3+/spermidine/putrescine transport system ATPase subunit
LQLRAEIKRLHDELGFSAIYVTHDQSEAMAMSSRVAVMDKGHIVQIDKPDVIFHAPKSEFVFTFIGESCCLPVLIQGGEVRDKAGTPVDLRLAKPPAAGEWRLYVRPSRVVMGAAAAAAENRITATVAFAEFLGDFSRYHFKTGALELFCDYSGTERFHTGQPCLVGWDSAHMSVFQ